MRTRTSHQPAKLEASHLGKSNEHITQTSRRRNEPPSLHQAAHAANRLQSNLSRGCHKADLPTIDTSTNAMSADNDGAARPIHVHARSAAPFAMSRVVHTMYSMRWNPERDTCEACTCEAIARIEAARAFASARALLSKTSMHGYPDVSRPLQALRVPRVEISRVYTYYAAYQSTSATLRGKPKVAPVIIARPMTLEIHVGRESISTA